MIRTVQQRAAIMVAMTSRYVHNTHRSSALLSHNQSWSRPGALNTTRCVICSHVSQDAHPRLSLDKKTQYIMLIDRGPGACGTVPLRCSF